MRYSFEYIEIEDKNGEIVKYPIAYNFNVAQLMQEKYGSVANWYDELYPDLKNTENTDKIIEPSTKVLIYSFMECINEGISIENEENEEKRKPLTEKQVGRIISLIDGEPHERLTSLVYNATKANKKEKN